MGARGLYAWSPDLEALGDERATVAVQELGPHLFPLIHRAEVRLTGARMLPAIEDKYQFRVADRYEMVGVVDVVTHVELADPAFAANPIVGALTAGSGPGSSPEVRGHRRLQGHAPTSGAEARGEEQPLDAVRVAVADLR